MLLLGHLQLEPGGDGDRRARPLPCHLEGCSGQCSSLYASGWVKHPQAEAGGSSHVLPAALHVLTPKSHSNALHVTVSLTFAQCFLSCAIRTTQAAVCHHERHAVLSESLDPEHRL